MSKPLSSCCQKPARLDMTSPDGSMFCTHCGLPCKITERKTPFKGYSTLSAVRKPSGEKEVFLKVWQRCKGKSEVGGEDLLPLDHPMWHWQFSHCLPKGSYPGDQLDPKNILAVTIAEHDEWPLVKEKTDAELRAMGKAHWIAKVTVFRALRLRYNTELTAKISGQRA